MGDLTLKEWEVALHRIFRFDCGKELIPVQHFNFFDESVSSIVRDEIASGIPAILLTTFDFLQLAANSRSCTKSEARCSGDQVLVCSIRSTKRSARDFASFMVRAMICSLARQISPYVGGICSGSALHFGSAFVAPTSCILGSSFMSKSQITVGSSNLINPSITSNR